MVEVEGTERGSREARGCEVGEKSLVGQLRGQYDGERSEVKVQRRGFEGEGCGRRTSDGER